MSSEAKPPGREQAVPVVSSEAKPPGRERAVTWWGVRAAVIAWWGAAAVSSEAQLPGWEAVTWWGVPW